jgi:hypothetical protein
MITTDIKSPIFKILACKNINSLEQESMRMFREGNWYPVGGVGRRGNDWIQVIVKEKNGGN